ncbi:MAG: choice-of-anchor Q domain-containing protein, partial [Thermoguttaceae bacterium]
MEALEDRTLLAGAPGAGFAHPNFLLSPDATASSSPQSSWFTPAQIRQAYGINAIKFGSVPGDGSGTTIAIVDAYDQPNIVADLQQFDQQFTLPNLVLTRVNQSGGPTLPSPDVHGGWGVETSLDVEWAHAIAPGANILLVEANDNSPTNMYAAVDYARKALGVVVVSVSWDQSEFFGENADDSYFTTPTGHNGVTFCVASGDAGAPPEYPAASPNVVAVGGTMLTLDASGNYSSEIGWYGSGGGIDTYESQPSYQKGVVTQSTTNRTAPDVAWNAVNYAVCDSYDFGSRTSWEAVDGTSASCPQWAATVAIADQGRAIPELSLDGPSQTLPALYALSAGNYHDITTGSSDGSPNYSAAPGYDLVTGLGTPAANMLVPQLAGIGLPNLTGISPATAATTGDTTVTINGTNLGSVGTAAVNFGAAAGSIVSDTGTQIVVTTHGGTAGTVDVTVITPAGTSVTSSADLFTYWASASTMVTTAKDVVDPNDGQTSLREAVAYADSNPGNNTITFDPSLAGKTITLTGGELDLTNTTGTTTIAGLGATHLTVNGNGKSRVFSISGNNTQAVISGLTISGGYCYDANGGGIYNAGGTVEIKDSTLTGNSLNNSGNGGGFFNNQGACTITNSVISDNSSVGDGGGLYNDGGSATITNSNISGNSAGFMQNGSGICNSGGTVHIRQSTVSGNSVNGFGSVFSSGGTLTVSNSTILGNSGGGIWGGGGTVCVSGSILSNNGGGGAYVASGATATFTNSTIAENWINGNASNARGGGIMNQGGLAVTNCNIQGNSAYLGGGIYNSGTLTVQNSPIWNNYAYASGGGLHNDSGGTLYVVNSTIANNWADCFDNNEGGGGIFNSQGTLTVTNSTVANNQGCYNGGGIYNASGTLTANNSIFASNVAGSSPDVYGAMTAQSGFDLIGVWPGSTPPAQNSIWGTSAAPLNPGLSNWTQLADGTWRYYLLNGSPAIDAGSNTLAVDPQGNALTVDEYGNQRIQPTGGTVDMGAVEGATTAAAGVTYTVQSLEWTVADVGPLTIREALQAADSNQPAGVAPAGSFGAIDQINFATGLTGTIALGGTQVTIHGGLEIVGPGAGSLTLDAAGESRGLEVRPGANVALSGCMITNGIDSDTGGGIQNSGNLIINQIVVSENLASYGGGIYNEFGTLTVWNSTISGNSAGNGGGIYNEGSAKVTNSTIADNSASDGGGISNFGALAVTNSTIAGNSALLDGGGIYNPGTVSLKNSIVATNAAASGLDVFWTGTVTADYSLIGAGYISGTPGVTNLWGTSVAPLNPGLSDWTQRADGTWRYYLLPGSPAIDAGSNALAVDPQGNPLTVDEYGNQRIQPTGGTVDMGAVEGVTAATAGVTYIVQSLDWTIADVGPLTIREALEAADSNQPVGVAPAGSFGNADEIKFAPGLAGTITLDGTQVTIHGDLDIVGPGPNSLTLDAAGKSRGLEVCPGSKVTLSGMTITGGDTTDDGGGILNCGDLTLDQMVLTGNSAACGGGIRNVGTLTVTSSTIADNSASFAFSYSGGGGVYNSGAMTLVNSTIARNSFTYGDFYTASGGAGIYSYCGVLTITNATIAYNSFVVEAGSFSGEGGGIYMRSPGEGETNLLTLQNSIVALNTASSSTCADVDGDGISLTGQSGYDLVGVWPGSTPPPPPPPPNSLAGTTAAPLNPGLSGWSEVGNGTWGYELLPGCPAIDVGSNGLVPPGVTTDQRGLPRIVNGTVDIGACEDQPVWSGGGAPAAWSNAANWGGRTVLANSPLGFSGSTGLNSTNDFPADTPFSGFTFTADAGAFNLSGNAVNLAGDITDNSPIAQTMNLPLVLVGCRTLNTAAGNLTISQAISQSGGSYGISKTGPGTVVLSCVNTYTGGTTIDAGVITATSSASVPPGGAVVLAGGNLVLNFGA